jgi:hypothetical protein
MRGRTTRPAWRAWPSSVHLGFPANGEVENLEQALDGADLVAREALARGIPAVLTGDLNARASALSVRALTTGEILGGDAPFVDAWAVAGSGPDGQGRRTCVIASRSSGQGSGS